MKERLFLAYILYISLVEIREKAYSDKDSRLYHLADLLHNIPFSLLSESSSKEEYSRLLDAVEFLNLTDWLKAREEEFKKRYESQSDDNAID